MDALTYRYEIAGSGFDLVLLAIYAHAQSATAFILVRSVSPDPANTNGAFQQWLLQLGDEPRAPSDPVLDEMFLR